MDATYFSPPEARDRGRVRAATAAHFARRPWIAAAALVTLLSALAMFRPIDHDESQYIAAAVLSGEGLLPYRDYAYLQTPLQPLLFGPLAWLFGEFAYPGLRLVNALLGAVAIIFVYLAAKAGGVRTPIALAAAGLFATTDVLLFGTGVARNDALPTAALSVALWLIVRGEGRQRSAWAALATGLLLSAAAATKASYALPALAYGIWTLVDRHHRPLFVALGAALPAILLVWLASLAPAAFWFGVFDFPANAPEQYYSQSDRAYKLSFLFRLLDVTKFLALGAALPALVAVALAARRGGDAYKRIDRLLDFLVLVALVSALLPEPTWRQYLLPVLPPLFLRLARLWRAAPPQGRQRALFALFAFAGTVPTGLAFVAALEGVPMVRAVRDGRAVGRILTEAGVVGPVATLAPHLLPAARRQPDLRFAPGPFYFRSRGLLTPAEEVEFGLVSRDALDPRTLPEAVLLGGEAAWAGGDAREDAKLAAAARKRGAREVAVPGGRLRLLLLPPRAGSGGGAAVTRE